MYVGLKQPRVDGERYVTPARAAAKETNCWGDIAPYKVTRMHSVTLVILLLVKKKNKIKL